MRGSVATSGKNGHDQWAVRSWHRRSNTFFYSTRFIWLLMCHVPFNNTTPSYLIKLLWSGLYDDDLTAAHFVVVCGRAVCRKGLCIN